MLNWMPFYPLTSALLSRRPLNIHLNSIMKEGLIRYLRTLDKEVQGNLFVYFHLYSPHTPYECSFSSTKFSYNYDKFILSFYLENLPKRVKDLPHFYRFSHLVSDGLLRSGLLSHLKEEYCKCANKVIDFFTVLSENFPDWNIILIGDHPEYFGEGNIIAHPPILPLTAKKVPLLYSGEYDIESLPLESNSEIYDLILQIYGYQDTPYSSLSDLRQPYIETLHLSLDDNSLTGYWGVGQGKTLYYEDNSSTLVFNNDNEKIRPFLEKIKVTRKEISKVLLERLTRVTS